ncbi:MAG: ATP-dependent DNA helicase RecG [Gammaproteobacteria bacterium]|nr:ATP-dependent DNA helicase RecG [Gammaproteobacteria bacterium]
MAAPPRFEDPVERLAGVGPKLAEGLAKLRIRLVGDLLFHLPLRYEDRTRLTPIGTLRQAREALIEGTIDAAQVVFGRRRALLCRVSDGSGALHLRFFHFNRSQQLRLAAGRRVRCYGEVRRGPQTLEMVHPEVQVIDPEQPTPVDAELTPVYPTTEGLHQLRLRRLTDQALALLDDDDAAAADIIPAALRERLGLPSLAAALRFVHRPPPDADTERLAEKMHPAQRRLVFEELLAHQVSLRQLRAKARAFAAPAVSGSDLRTRLVAGLGFTLTGAQQRVIGEIDEDLASGVPMLRLLQGDVGAGKTAVAAAIAALLLDHDYQVALMAPTELLAEQHAANLRRWFAPLGIEVVLLTSRLSKSQRAPLLGCLAERRATLAVGTHALFQQDVAYANLGLIIVDEQHRFGVDQRLALRDKGARDGYRPHQLIMTATPIPRTLAMTAYADLDVSVLDELPPNRKPVRTVVLAESKRADIVARIADLVGEGRQVYWVCPLIEESELLESQAATETASQLAAALPGIRVGLVHGRLADRDKDAAMAAFAGGDTDLLVATTVIEVGVDVPNASLMVIENAERLGLSQLHQLRGRVGRGARHADCVLLYKGPLSLLARQRLEVMRQTTDGFVIADRDLALRGPGELLGTRQAGVAQFRIADLSRDAALLGDVQQAAEVLLAEHPAVAAQLVERWLARRVEYANV